jgi:hypothetical protein
VATSVDALRVFRHVSFHDPSACVDRERDYLTELITPPKGTVCRSDRKPFEPGFGEAP